LGHVIRLRREIVDGLPWQKTQLQRQTSIQASSTTLCNQQSATYSITPPFPGMTINWTTSNPILQVTSGQGTSSVTVQATMGSGGYYTVNCVASTPCYLVNSSVSVHVGGYSNSDYPVSGPSVACKNSYVYFSTNTLPGATDYVWFWPASDWTYSSGNHTPNLVLRTGTVSGPVGVRVANACDPGGAPAMRFVQVNNCGFRFVVSPNPTNGTIEVHTLSSSAIVERTTDEANRKTNGAAQKTDENERIYRIKIVDQLGVIRQQFSYSKGITNTSINLSKLAAGIYILQVYNGSTWSSQQIIKQ